MNMTPDTTQALIDALTWALEQIEPSLDPDHQAAMEAATAALKRATFVARIKECAEDGQVATVWSGMDCDCVRYEGSVRCCEATPEAVEALADRVHEWADGPCSFYIERPSVANQLRYSSRDLALEAYEDGHPHVIYA